MEWLKSAPSSSADGIRYAVFGCGHTDWASTYQSIPTLIDERLSSCGAERIYKRGVGNAAGADLFGDFDDWADQLWAVLSKENKLSISGQAPQGLQIEVDSRLRVEALRHGFLGTATVLSNKVITRGDDFEVKRHVEIAMPEGTVYRAGDYLGVLPVSPLPLVQRALIRFGLALDDVLTIKSTSSTSFPIDRIAAVNVFSGFVELDQPATLRNVKLMAERAEDRRDELARLTEPSVYAAEISAKRVSLLSLMEQYPEVQVTLAEFLENVPLIRMRQVGGGPPAHTMICALIARPSSVLDLLVSAGQARPRLHHRGDPGRPAPVRQGPLPRSDIQLPRTPLARQQDPGGDPAVGRELSPAD